MSTETGSKAVIFEKRKIYPTGTTVGRARPMELQGEYGPEITQFNEVYSILATLEDTATLGDMAKLFEHYLQSELGVLDLKNEQDTLLKYLFAETGKGNVCANAANYSFNDSGLKKIHESDRRVLWVVRPEYLDHKNIKGGEEYPECVPITGWIAFPEDTGKGLFRRTKDGEVLGIPEFTVPTKEEAKRTFIDRGFSEKFAENAVSKWYSRGEGDGVSAVVRYSGGRNGQFVANADEHPSDRSSSFGRFPSSRSPSGARHAGKNEIADQLVALAAQLRSKG